MTTVVLQAGRGFKARWWDSAELSVETKDSISAQLSGEALQELLDVVDRRKRDAETALDVNANPTLLAAVVRAIGGLESKAWDAVQLLSDVVVVLTAKGPERRTIEEAAAIDALPGVNVAETWQDPATFRALVPDGSPAHLLTKPAVEVATGVVAQNVVATWFSLENIVLQLGSDLAVAPECQKFADTHAAVIAPIAVGVTSNPPGSAGYKAIVAAGYPVDDVSTTLEWTHDTPPKSMAIKQFLAEGRRDRFLVVFRRMIGTMEVYGVVRQRMAPKPGAKYHRIVGDVCVYGEFGFAPANCFRVVAAPQFSWHERYHSPPGCESPRPLIGQGRLSWRVWHVVKASGYMMG